MKNRANIHTAFPRAGYTSFSMERPERRARATGIVLGAIHLGACAAIVPAFFSWSGVIVALVLYNLTGGIGICLGFHRMLTHRSIRFARPVEYVIATLGTLALQGGPIAWVGTHRAHHAYSDTARDPHDSNRGFWWSHVEWLYRANSARLTRDEEARFAVELAADPYYRFLERTAVLWQIGLGIVLFALGGWSWLVWGIFVRLVLLYNATWLVNSAAHLMGYRTYRTPGADRSTNNGLVALFAWGEGWHNNHHAFPASARHGMRWFEFDLTWMTIEVLRMLRIARDVKVPDAAALRRRMLVAGARESVPVLRESAPLRR
jgi:stearoyl-CoA desaturase (delta-9 desaturase)